MTTIKKSVASTTAANKVDHAKAKREASIRTMTAGYREDAVSAVGVVQFTYVKLARAVTRNTDECEPLLKAFGKQRRSEAAGLIAAADDDFAAVVQNWAPKKRKLGLQIAARCLRVQLVSTLAGFDESHAREFIKTGKKDSFTLAQGKKITPEKADAPDAPDLDSEDAPTDAPTAPRDTQLPIGGGPDPFELQNAANKAWQAVYGESKDPAIKAALASLAQITAILVTATANEA